MKRFTKFFASFLIAVASVATLSTVNSTPASALLAFDYGKSICGSQYNYYSSAGTTYAYKYGNTFCAYTLKQADYPVTFVYLCNNSAQSCRYQAGNFYRYAGPVYKSFTYGSGGYVSGGGASNLHGGYNGYHGCPCSGAGFSIVNINH